jgi:5'-3' exonuclease
MPIALIDADILVYRVGYASETVSQGIALARLRESINGILDALNLSQDNYQAYLSANDKSNFRYNFYQEYKANRKQPRPVHYDIIRDALVNDYEAKLISGQEADDAIGIDNKRYEDSIIVSIDKDLNQLPGKHFNFVKGLLYTVSPEEGLKYFYKQLLTGDRTDNIPGLTGIGEKRADKALASAGVEKHMFEIAKQMYQNEFQDQWNEVMLRNGRLLKIRQEEHEIWQFPDVDETQTDESATNEVD